MKTHGIGKTDVGRVRDRNEDTFFTDDELGVFVVADGMGGHAAGDVAAAAAVDTVVATIRAALPLLEEARSTPVDFEPIRALVERAVVASSAAVYELAAHSPERTGMGCTLTVLVAAGRQAVMAHVGDSRLYLIRGDHATQLSSDHTLAQELADHQVIAAQDVKTHRWAHVLSRAVGSKPDVAVDTRVIEIAEGDTFLLCSDGLSEYLTDDDWVAARFGESDFDHLPERLIRFANECGGKDNITVVVARVDEDAVATEPGVIASVIPVWEDQA